MRGGICLRIATLAAFLGGTVAAAGQTLNSEGGTAVPSSPAVPAGTVEGAAGGASIPSNFGTLHASPYWIPFADFRGRETSATWAYDGLGYSHRTGGDTDFWAPLHLDNGIEVISMRAFHYDTSASDLVVFFTYYQDDDNPTFSDVATLTAAAGTPGYTTDFVNIFHTIDNYPNGTTPDQERVYVVIARMIDASANMRLKGVRVWWQRQVSPAPATATFLDVPTSHPFFQFIEALVASGITVGCGGSNYCPDAPLTRGQMAVFLAKGLGLHFANP